MSERPSPPGLYTTRQVAEALGISSRRVQQIAAANLIGQWFADRLVLTDEDIELIRSRVRGWNGKKETQ